LKGEKGYLDPLLKILNVCSGKFLIEKSSDPTNYVRTITSLLNSIVQLLEMEYHADLDIKVIEVIHDFAQNLNNHNVILQCIQNSNTIPLLLWRLGRSIQFTDVEKAIVSSLREMSYNNTLVHQIISGRSFLYSLHSLMHFSESRYYKTVSSIIGSIQLF
jgi:hypothetical protein